MASAPKSSGANSLASTICTIIVSICDAPRSHSFHRNEEAKNAFYTLVKIRLDFIYWYNNAYHSLTSNPNRKMIILRSCFPPHHLVYDTNIALNDPDHLIRYVDILIVRYRDSQITVLNHLHCQINGLKKANCVDSR
jgi:hypothetical protein